MKTAKALMVIPATAPPVSFVPLAGLVDVGVVVVLPPAAMPAVVIEELDEVAVVEFVLDVVLVVVLSGIQPLV